MRSIPVDTDGRGQLSGVPVVVNPGAGSIEARTRQKHAEANMRAFRRDLVSKYTLPRLFIIYRPGTKHGGRYTFALRLTTTRGQVRECEVEMPGLPLDQVRFMRAAEQNPWHYPRLYVNRDSWLWIYALSVAGDKLRGRR